MCMMQGLSFSLVHAVLILAVSFFVLLAARKTDSQNIKTFGYVIAALLWVGAALVFSKGISGRHPMSNKMYMTSEKMGMPMPRGEAPQQGGQTAPNK